MRRLFAGIAPLVMALLLIGGTFGGTDEVSAVEADHGFIVPATHAVGTVTGMAAWCSTMSYVDILLEQALIPQNVGRYQEIMTEEMEVKCFDVRFYEDTPGFPVAFVKHIKTVETSTGHLLEIWKVVDRSGTFGYTWTSHDGQGV